MSHHINLNTLCYVRHIYIYTCGAIYLTHHGSSLGQTAPAKPIYEASEFQQVCNTEERPLLTHDDLRIGSDNVSPMRRNRANGFIVDLQQQSFPIAVIPLAHAR